LLSHPAGGGGASSSVAGGQDPVLCCLGVTGMLISGYSLPPPPALSTPSRIMDDQTVWRVMGRERPLVILCNAMC